MIVGASQSEPTCAQQALMEANLSIEVAMIVLDTVTLYVNSFKVITYFHSVGMRFNVQLYGRSDVT